MLQHDLVADERGTRTASAARDALERVVRLLDEISEYSRLTRGELRLDRQPTPWAHVVAAVRRNAVLPSTPHIQWLDVDVPSSAAVTVDAARIERALTTLVEAVTRAQTGDGFVTVELTRIREDPDPGPALDVAVVAEGAVELRKPDVSRGGLGFGLVLAEAFVAAHGARLEERWQGGRWTGYRIAGLASG
jgi:signal transduction histidine kinase